MTKNNLLLFSANNDLCDRARRRGIDFLLVEHPLHCSRLPNQSLEQVLILDYENSPHFLPFVAAAHAVAPFKMALSLFESGLLPAARFNERLGIPATSVSAVKRIRDKWAMREYMAQAGLASLKAAAVDNVADIKNFAEKAGYPIILKPRDGRGSQGVRLLTDPAQLDGCCNQEQYRNLIVEEYIEGPEYSAETFSFNGRHIIFALTQKTVAKDNPFNPFLEIGHQIPAAFPKAVNVEELHHFLCDFLDMIGIKDGPAHTEFKISQGRPVIVETHNRTGGDFIVDLVRLATNHDLFDYTVSWPTGLVAALDKHVEPVRGAAIRYFLPSPGLVRKIHGVESSSRKHGIVEIKLEIGLGEHVPSPKSSGDRVGHVIASASTAAEAARICEAVIAGVTIETDLPQDNYSIANSCC